MEENQKKKNKLFRRIKKRFNNQLKENHQFIAVCKKQVKNLEIIVIKVDNLVNILLNYILILNRQYPTLGQIIYLIIINFGTNNTLILFKKKL